MLLEQNPKGGTKMEGYKKYTMRDHLGNIVFPETHAEVVRETPDRRFMDNAEKQILTRFSGKVDTVDMLLDNAESIKALISEEVAISQMIDKIPDNLSDIILTVEDLNRLTPKIDDLLDVINRSAFAYSSINQGVSYNLLVDDTNPESPKLVFHKNANALGQPSSYLAGDTWVVPNNTPDVLIRLKPNTISFDNTRKTVLVLNEGNALTPVSEEIRTNIVNGVQNEIVESKDEFIPQIYMKFDVRETLKTYFGGAKEWENTISAFTMSVLSQPTNETSSALTQVYMNGNVVQPIREAMKSADYSTNTFQAITWTNSLDANFIRGWLNNAGQAAVVTYAGVADAVSVAKPELDLYIANPYAGRTLTAKSDMGEEFSILDWEVNE